MTPPISPSRRRLIGAAETAAGPAHAASLCGREFVLQGRVQGVGVRPAVCKLAAALGLRGRVRNSARGVVIAVEGPAADVARFERALPRVLPRGAQLAHIGVEPAALQGYTEFAIVKDATAGPLAVRVPEDRAACDACLTETFQPRRRRFRYPFTSCTQCGPRYTVIRAMPYEREDTELADFPLCRACAQEYQAPRNRRFHAQTLACRECGPRVWLTADAGVAAARDDRAIASAVRLLRQGKIVAIRGVGGYQLLVDAADGAAVERLRRRKARRTKPLAVMVASPQAAEALAYLDDAERAALGDASAPIVLARARADNGLAAAIHPQLNAVGVMLPASPLHALLARDFGRPLVCTSGNREGDPLEYEAPAAERRLAGVADAWLHHDREITRPIDDSVVRVIAGRRVTIRLGRGLAPLALDLPNGPPTLAVGGYLKAAVAWANGAQAVLGPHLGDQESLAARERFAAHLDDVQRLYRFRPRALVHDAHPEYYSTQWACAQGLPLRAVQHHHAHVAAGMLEHGWLDRTVLGVAWDGTGYGADGDVWGGEFLLATAAAFRRVARLRPFALPGGEAAIREPWRIAAAIVEQLEGPPGRWRRLERAVAPERIASLRRIMAAPQLAPRTSSAGRLFDAAAALILGLTRVDFDGQAAMRLEANADRAEKGAYDLPLRDGDPAELDWRPMFAALLADGDRGVDPGAMAMRFHRGLARAVVDVCRRWSSLPVVLTGGVFQNRLLTEQIVELWGDAAQPLGLPGVIPPNDGGLAAGQLAVALVGQGG